MLASETATPLEPTPVPGSDPGRLRCRQHRRPHRPLLANTAPDTGTSYPASDPRARTAGPGPVSIANRSDAVRCSPRPALAEVLKMSVEDVSGFRPGEWKDRWLRTVTI